MKVRRIKKYVSFFLMFCILMTGRYAITAEAGASNIVVDSSSFAEELDTSLWNNVNGDIQLQDGVLIFPKESTDTTSLITKTNAKCSEYHKELVSADVSMQMTRIPKKETFVLALGLGSIEALMGEPGNVEIGFTNQGGLKVSVTAYDDAGKAVVLKKAVACGTAGSKLTVKATISTKRVLDVKINGKQICNVKLPVSGEGYVGFLQTGSCEVKVSDVRIVSHKYDRPENYNIKEDFEKETINTAVLTSKMVYPNYTYAPTKTYIDEWNGNRVFRFQNAGVVYIGSTCKYSNFELTFDVLGLQREDIYDKDGNIVTPKNANFAVSYGDEAADYDGNGYLTSTDILVFGAGSVVQAYFTGKTESALEEGYPFYAADCKKDFSIRVSMIDSVVTVGVKWIEEKEFTDFMTYQVSEQTPTGYVHIWTTSTVANMAIDNLKIVNKDRNPNLMKAEYQSAKITVPGDYEYQPVEYAYMEKAEKEEFNLYLIIPAFAAICLLAIAVSIFVRKGRDKKRVIADHGRKEGERE